ncbi:hypothetical protein H6G41_16620 [Tolypothrix sp. FACHB-123]|uniref:hypothetical protein n=1 Tax=Tolypothrix sp. FACHB-123 TaxID=2692868 RepID=UPI001687559E|nr:hypothetical protein [Tolypothrix sp. FACHB-123]MBD2356231.1 hypothetical protein [Tolypothrix sp. FACHB-123]
MVTTRFIVVTTAVVWLPPDSVSLPQQLCGYHQIQCRYHSSCVVTTGRFALTNQGNADAVLMGNFAYFHPSTGGRFEF